MASTQHIWWLHVALQGMLISAAIYALPIQATRRDRYLFAVLVAAGLLFLNLTIDRIIWSDTGEPVLRRILWAPVRVYAALLYVAPRSVVIGICYFGGISVMWILIASIHSRLPSDETFETRGVRNWLSVIAIVAFEVYQLAFLSWWLHDR